jgi:hypothetical protein
VQDDQLRPGGGKVIVIAAGRTARVVANGTDDIARKRRASYVPIATDTPLADLVFAELRRRRVVG